MVDKARWTASKWPKDRRVAGVSFYGPQHPRGHRRRRGTVHHHPQAVRKQVPLDAGQGQPAGRAPGRQARHPAGVGQRDPLAHRPEFGTTRADFEAMTAPDFWETGASARAPQASQRTRLLRRPPPTSGRSTSVFTTLPLQCWARWISRKRRASRSRPSSSTHVSAPSRARGEVGESARAARLPGRPLSEVPVRTSPSAPRKCASPASRDRVGCDHEHLKVMGGTSSVATPARQPQTSAGMAMAEKISVF